eukprot:g2462.t1
MEAGVSPSIVYPLYGGIAVILSTLFNYIQAEDSNNPGLLFTGLSFILIGLGLLSYAQNCERKQKGKKNHGNNHGPKQSSVLPLSTNNCANEKYISKTMGDEFKNTIQATSKKQQCNTIADANAHISTNASADFSADVSLDVGVDASLRTPEKLSFSLSTSILLCLVSGIAGSLWSPMTAYTSQMINNNNDSNAIFVNNSAVEKRLITFEHPKKILILENQYICQFLLAVGTFLSMPCVVIFTAMLKWKQQKEKEQKESKKNTSILTNDDCGCKTFLSFTIGLISSEISNSNYGFLFAVLCALFLEVGMLFYFNAVDVKIQNATAFALSACTPLVTMIVDLSLGRAKELRKKTLIIMGVVFFVYIIAIAILAYAALEQ